MADLKIVGRDDGDGPPRLRWAESPVPAEMRGTTARAFQARLPDGQQHLQAVVWLSPEGWRAQVACFSNLLSPFPPHEPIPAARQPTLDELLDVALRLVPEGVGLGLPLRRDFVSANGARLAEFGVAKVEEGPPQ